MLIPQFCAPCATPPLQEKDACSACYWGHGGGCWFNEGEMTDVILATKEEAAYAIARELGLAARKFPLYSPAHSLLLDLGRELIQRHIE